MRLNGLALQLSPDVEQACIPKIFPFQNEGPGAANLLSALDQAIGARRVQNLPLPERRTPFLFGPKKRKADCVVGPKKRKADCVVRPCTEGSARPSLGLSAWFAGKMATEKLVRRELLKAPALLGGEGRPLLRHCVVTRESGSLAGWRTVAGCRRAPLV